MDIPEKIKEKLKETERAENVRIIYCAESGSRSWGFASPDSDYDARFIYTRSPDFYLKLGKTRDVIEWQLDDVFDISGWDLQKMLRLLYSSNAAIFEWKNSTIKYRTSDIWQEIDAIMDEHFNRRAVLCHYISLAKGNYMNNLTGESVKLKKYFYSLRPVLAARWIIDKGTPPPMPFSELCSAELDGSLTGVIEELLEKKKNSAESDLSPHIPLLDSYISESIPELTALSEKVEPTGSKDWSRLDEVFLKAVGLH